MNKKIYIIPVLMVAASLTFSSCSDFFDQESDHVVFADQEHLNNATDTIYSVTGIMDKVQKLADRTILFGELRGDLVDLNSNASADLIQIANFAVNDSNKYNNPRDYYAVINNCNYFLERVKTDLEDNRHKQIFKSEYAAVKAYRAWAYMQLVMLYGKVPYITKPILTREESEKDYPKMKMEQLFPELIADLTPYADVMIPLYGSIRNTDSRMLYFPVHLLIADMQLWIGNYREAALSYYKYIHSHSALAGGSSDDLYPMGTNRISWLPDDTKYTSFSTSYQSIFSSEAFGTSSELITMIAGDSIPSEGNYSDLRDIFNCRSTNDYKEAQVIPSQGLKDLSGAQIYCNYNSNHDVIYAPQNLDHNRGGDLRLISYWTEGHGVLSSQSSSKQLTVQTISKYNTRNIHLYRRTMVYMRMAEALNRAGFPLVAYNILKTGINNDVLDSLGTKYYPKDKEFLAQFDFPSTQYILRASGADNYNIIGLHSRGCGFTEYNEQYAYPVADSLLVPDNATEKEIVGVEDLLVDEEALEFAFEGHRYYDLMRVAKHRNDPSYLGKMISKRKGINDDGSPKEPLKIDLSSQDKWYISWKNTLGWNY